MWLARNSYLLFDTSDLSHVLRWNVFYLWIFEINFDSGQRKDQSSVKSHLSPWDGSIELLAVFEPFQRVNVSSDNKKRQAQFHLLLWRLLLKS